MFTFYTREAGKMCHPTQELARGQTTAIIVELGTEI